ncbi:hypothetical protein [Streptomyces malaysiensis]|uniref:hypothetical protein n=1 Tax=Streptomyces malaysiensis TaxID=92644 RepID=UPI000BFC3937|nr:hypothetical protein [Streptomyces malaysiensis]QDL74080.1 hypothetical protein DNK48_37440 [Streptomyces malaysiensis]
MTAPTWSALGSLLTAAPDQSPGPPSPELTGRSVGDVERRAVSAEASAWAVSLPNPLDAPVITMIVRWLPRWPG